MWLLLCYFLPLAPSLFFYWHFSWKNEHFCLTLELQTSFEKRKKNWYENKYPWESNILIFCINFMSYRLEMNTTTKCQSFFLPHIISHIVAHRIHLFDKMRTIKIGQIRTAESEMLWVKMCILCRMILFSFWNCSQFRLNVMHTQQKKKKTNGNNQGMNGVEGAISKHVNF